MKPKKGTGLGIWLGSFLAIVTGAQAQTEVQLQQAVQEQDWQQAIQQIDHMSETDPTPDLAIDQQHLAALAESGSNSTANSEVALTVLYRFSIEQGQPIRLLSGQDGALYGITSQSRVFRLTLDGDLQTIFTAPAHLNLNHPTSPSTEAIFLQAADGHFYGVGTTDPSESPNWLGHYGNRDGVIYRLTTAGAFTPLYRTNHIREWKNPNPRQRIFPPVSLMQADDGAFYGMTSGNQMFRFQPTESLTLLHQFQDPDVIQPWGLVQTDQGGFLGLRIGDPSIKTFHYGDVFQITGSGQIQVKHPFNGVMGSYPYGLIKASDGHFYGVTQRGGSVVIYPREDYASSNEFHRVDCPCTTADCLEACKEKIRQEVPYLEGGNLVFWDCIGNQGCGTIYRLTAEGEITRIHNFNSQSGYFPIGSLVETASGDLYGITSQGGPSGGGSLFKITPSGQLSYVHFFNSAVVGSRPQTSLILGPDQAIYGSTSQGGSVAGTIFRLEPK